MTHARITPRRCLPVAGLLALGSLTACGEKGPDRADYSHSRSWLADDPTMNCGSHARSAMVYLSGTIERFAEVNGVELDPEVVQWLSDVHVDARVLDARETDRMPTFEVTLYGAAFGPVHNPISCGAWTLTPFPGEADLVLAPAESEADADWVLDLTFVQGTPSEQ